MSSMSMSRRQSRQQPFASQPLLPSGRRLAQRGKLHLPKRQVLVPRNNIVGLNPRFISVNRTSQGLRYPAEEHSRWRRCSRTLSQPARLNSIEHECLPICPILADNPLRPAVESCYQAARFRNVTTAQTKARKPSYGESQNSGRIRYKRGEAVAVGWTTATKLHRLCCSHCAISRC
jgi:hypothetical protein